MQALCAMLLLLHGSTCRRMTAVLPPPLPLLISAPRHIAEPRTFSFPAYQDFSTLSMPERVGYLQADEMIPLRLAWQGQTVAECTEVVTRADLSVGLAGCSLQPGYTLDQVMSFFLALR